MTYHVVSEEIQMQKSTYFFGISSKILIGVSLINSSFKISNGPFFLML